MLDNLEEMIATIERASNQILSKISGPVECLLMLGTGLGTIANRVEVEFRFSYKEIPGFPVSTALSWVTRSASYSRSLRAFR